MSRLAVSGLRLTDFRNYAAASLAAEAPFLVLTGPNGAGKTNLLEALSFLSPGRGLRRAALGQADRLGGGAWAVAATVATADGPVDLGTGRDPTAEGERRLVRVDGRPVRGQQVLAELFSVVWLTPQQDRLFLEGPGQRRRFFDRLVYAFDPAHAGRVGRYEQAWRDRARLLRPEPGAGPADPRWLAALEAEIAATGTALAAARRDLALRLDAACAAAGGPFPRARVAVDGLVEAWLAEAPALAVEDRFRSHLAQRRDGEGDGPHRSDLAVSFRDRDMPAAQCSTGEQKALLLSLLLAHAGLRAAEAGAAPVLLLDEVAAHLDRDRRAALFDRLAAMGAQAWLTGTDAETFAPLSGRAQFFRVADGHVTETDGPVTR
ncbi:MAG: DNA replication/repair protein RecF [Thalassobaculales bacterium]